MATVKPPFPLNDYIKQSKERVTEQFSNKKVIGKVLELLADEQMELQNTFRDLLQLRSIDQATGENLDNIGRIVGQPRELLDTSILEYFAYQGYPDAGSYGDLNNPSTGGLYYSLGQPLTGNTLLSDSQYRLFIKAKILKNNTNATPEDFLKFINFVFGIELSSVLIEGDAQFTILVGKELTSFERLLLTYSSSHSGYKTTFVPKPLGVRINFGQFDSSNYFGFQGAPNAKGYGDLNDSSTGGKYASFIS